MIVQIVKLLLTFSMLIRNISISSFLIEIELYMEKHGFEWLEDINAFQFL